MNLSEHWISPEPEPDSSLSLSESLKDFVTLRGAIAHGATPRVGISKQAVSAFYQIVSRIVEKTDEAVGVYLEDNGVVRPWGRHAIAPFGPAPEGQPLGDVGGDPIKSLGYE